MTSNGLNFVGTTLKKTCYETNFTFGVDNVCAGFNCRSLEFESTLTKVDETARVYITRATTLIVIELPERCKCRNGTLSPPNDGSVTTAATTIPVLVIVIVVLVLVILCYRKGKKIYLDK